VLEPPGPFSGIFQQNSRDDGGMIDVRAAAEAFTTQEDPSGPGIGGFNIGGILAADNVKSWSSVLDLTYQLDNGVSINSQTGWVFYETLDSRDNNDVPFFEDLSSRSENYYQISQQIRVETPTGGFEISPDIYVEVMGGVFRQESDLDLYSSSLRANVRRGQRFNSVWEDSKWTAGFWGLTFHLMDRQISLSAGGRYTDIHKDAFLRGFGAQWIYDEVPCDADELDDNPATCNIDPNFKRVDPTLTTYTTLDPITGNDSDARPDRDRDVRIDSPRILVGSADLTNLWTSNNFNRNRTAPRNWRGGGADAVGLTAPVYSVREGPFGPCDFCIEDVNQDVNNYDHQFVIRYTPNAFDGDHSFYAKYATAFKGPVTDSGRTGLPADLDELICEPEYTKAWEIGAKGNYWDNRGRYNIAGFISKFRDLQTAASAPLSVEALGIQSVIALNAGGQKVEGFEFSTTAAVMEGLTVDFAGMFMRGKMIEFDGGGCSGHEIIAASADAVNNPSGRSADELDLANEILDDIGRQRRFHALNSDIPQEYLRNGGCRLEDEDLPDGGVGEAETHNLSGISSAYTPNWKFVMSMNYTRPFTDNLEYFVNVKGLISDAYKTGLASYVVSWPTHGDVNLSVGIGDQNGSWRLIGYARNLLEATQVYNEEFDFVQDGLTTGLVKDSSFMSYGIKFEYRYR
jgi:hypothetical protein